MEGMMKRTFRECKGVSCLFVQGSKLNKENNTKIKIQRGLRWRPFDILHATTNQKHVGMTERG
jgi:hypothetical protein